MLLKKKKSGGESLLKDIQKQRAVSPQNLLGIKATCRVCVSGSVHELKYLRGKSMEMSVNVI